MKTSKSDFIQVLNILRTIPQAYYSQGPETIIREMQHVVNGALNGKYAGISGK